METTVRSKIQPKLLAVGVGCFILGLGVIASLRNGLGPTLPLSVVLALLLAVSFVSWVLAIGPEERAEEETPDEEKCQVSEEEQVYSYRQRQFLALGVSDEIAAVLGRRPTVSVQEMARLIERGCPVDKAVRILWPD